MTTPKKSLAKVLLDTVEEFADDVVSVLRPRQRPRLVFKKFKIQRFRGVEEVEISLVKNDLVLLLGLNESGKTTILRGIEAFDFRNDPLDANRLAAFKDTIRKKSDLFSNESATITAEIHIEGSVSTQDLMPPTGSTPLVPAQKELIEKAVAAINSAKVVRIARVFPFQDGRPLESRYEFSDSALFGADTNLGNAVAKEIVDSCPFIIYFEDFTDRIPEKIYASGRLKEENLGWYDIIDGLFYHSDQPSIQDFSKLFSPSAKRLDDASTVMKRVNATLNTVFTKRWQKLSGVMDIRETELIAKFEKRPKYFEIKITDNDNTTYSVDERSKGALWYLSFLMKTEFRRKKMRKDYGKPVFLIDEPASNLHSTAQKNMIQDFKQIVDNTSIIYTTHSQYLISLDNVKFTYVIRREEGQVSATIWSEYLRAEQSEVSHYQPLANLLEIVPNNLDIPWENAVITEGPNDKDVLELMYRVLYSELTDYVIYPGTGAHNLSTLISLNLGWGSHFRVLLDSDKSGREAKAKYDEDFLLDEEAVVLLPVPNAKIEKYFTVEERKGLYLLAMGTKKAGKITKNEFRKSLAILNGMDSGADDVTSIVGSKTIERFEKLFEALGIEPQ